MDKFLEDHLKKCNDELAKARILRTVKGNYSEGSYHGAAADLCDHVLKVDFKTLNELKPFRVIVYYYDECTEIIERWCRKNRDFVKGCFFRDKNNRLSFFYSEYKSSIDKSFEEHKKRRGLV